MKKLISIFLFFSGVAFADIGVTPTYVARSAGQNRVLLDVGGFWNGVDQQFESGDSVGSSSYSWFGYLAFIPAYSHSFNADKISESLFGCDSCGGCIKVQGSNVSNRDPKAWLADYMYLSPDFDGGFSIKPSIQNFIIDIDFYLGLDKIAPNTYLRLHGPLNWTKWSTRFCEKESVGAASSGYDEGYFAPDAVAASVLNSSITQYMQGEAPTISDMVLYGLQFAKFGCSDESQVGFADIHAELGWNFIQDDYHHIGISVQAVLPTGSHHDAEFVFNPMIGNGRHWELGGGLSTHYCFWRSQDEEKMAMLYFDISVTHLFNAYESRTFDVSDKPNSRYMLAEYFGPVVDNLTVDPDSAATSLSSTPPRGQFASIYSPVANLTTARLKIGSAVQVDFVALFDFSIRNMDLQIGYNLWARSSDSIANSRKCCSPLSIFNEENENVWGLKGDAHVFGYATVTAGGLTINDPVALSATESEASIHNGTNSAAAGTNPIERNLGVDSPEFAYAGTNNQRLNYARGLANVQASQIMSSTTPVLINFSNINLQPTRGLSNKLFAHFNYLWNYHSRVHPFIGGGLSAEFGMNKSYELNDHQAETNFIDICDDGPVTCSLSQWSIWLKGGFLFD